MHDVTDQIQRLARCTPAEARHLKIRDTIQTILETGDVVGTAPDGRTLLQLALDDWQLDALSAFAAELDDLKP